MRVDDGDYCFIGCLFVDRKFVSDCVVMFSFVSFGVFGVVMLGLCIECRLFCDISGLLGRCFMI